MLTLIVGLITFAVGVPVGAYSHKYLASEVQSVTGLNPEVTLGASRAVRDVQIVNPLQVQPPKA